MPYSKAIKFLLALTIACTTLSCEKKVSQHVWLVDGDDLEMLNGHVKRVTTGSDNSTDFNEAGDIIFSEIKYRYIRITEKDTDSTFVDRKTRYSLAEDSSGNTRTIIGTVSGTDQYRSKWTFNDRRQIIKYNSAEVDTIGDITEFSYNVSGDLIKGYTIHAGILLEPDLYKYKYDNSHHIIEMSLLIPPSALFDPNLRGKDLPLIKTRFEYKAFDTHDNWVKKIKYRDTYPPMERHSSIDTIYRKITYY